MKRTVFLSSLVFVWLAAAGIASNQFDASRACPFNITGLWRSDTGTETSRIFFTFSPEGHVTLLSYSPNTLPQDFEVITSVGYKLDNARAPKQIEFTALRGDDVFTKGVTTWKLVMFGDDSFTTLDPVSGRQAQWFREQTHRYFLTFGARKGSVGRGGPAFAVLTVMDGRETKSEALGVQMTKNESGKLAPVFGPISAELYNQVIEESEKDKKGGKQQESVIARFELTEAEYATTHATYQKWKEYVATHKVPYGDPYLNGLEFFSRAAEGLNQCGDKFNINRPTRRERDEIIAKLNPSQQPLEYIRMTRKQNAELHVSNSMYPWVWRPLIQQP